MIETQERPQNRNLKPFGSGQLMPEEERRLHSKGAKAANAVRKRNANLRAATRSLFNMSAKGRGRSMDMDRITSIEQLEDGTNVPLIMLFVYAQLKEALAGDKEARDWICKMLEDDPPKQITNGIAVAADDGTSSVRIHLIRGETAADPADPETTATRDREADPYDA